MTTEQFTYWLQGFVEIHGGVPTEEQWLIIKDHLQLVFKKESPKRFKNTDNIPDHLKIIIPTGEADLDDQKYCSTNKLITKNKDKTVC